MMNTELTRIEGMNKIDAIFFKKNTGDKKD